MATEAQKITYAEVAAPSTPAAGKVVVYAKADGLMYSKDDAGVETLLSSGAAVGSNPQFTTIELGHASDTTLARVSAGVVSIEGTNIVKAGAITTSGLTQATAKLLGRNTASTGAVEEITLGTNLSFSGTTLNASGGGSSPTTTTASATVATDESTSSTSYVDLSTSGPSVTITVNTACLVIVTSRIYGAGGYGRASFVASGANTVAVSDVNAFGSGLSTNDVRGSATTHLTGLTPGSTTFKMQYRALTSGTPHFLDRNIIVVPLD